MEINVVNEFGYKVHEKLGVSKDRIKVLDDKRCELVRAHCKAIDREEESDDANILFELVKECNSTEEVVVLCLNFEDMIEKCIACHTLQNFFDELR